MERFTVGLIVNNHYGVLTRVSGMYNTRGYNIDSLTVGPTENPAYSRMTIVSKGDEYIQSQVVKQLNKLHDVKEVAIIEEDNAMSLEHLLIKLKINGGSNKEMMELLLEYGAKIVELGEGFIIADLTAETRIIDEFIQKCVDYGIIELCRSGSIALSRDKEENVLSLEDIEK